VDWFFNFLYIFHDEFAPRLIPDGHFDLFLLMPLVLEGSFGPIFGTSQYRCQTILFIFKQIQRFVLGLFFSLIVILFSVFEIKVQKNRIIDIFFLAIATFDFEVGVVLQDNFRKFFSPLQMILNHIEPVISALFQSDVCSIVHLRLRYIIFVGG
jgi:hypothetical protein